MPALRHLTYRCRSLRALIARAALCCAISFTSPLFTLRALLAAPPDSAKPAPIDQEKFFRDQIQPLLKKYCLECHGPDAQEGDIAFHKFDSPAAIAADPKTWQRAIQMLRAGAMPPEDVPQPTAAEQRKLANWLEKTIYNFDCDGPIDPGQVTIRRLNRAEYNNTVRDLFGIAFRPADDFPSDDVGSGFDNIGEVLTLPPLLMEKYLAAAERIAEETIVTDPSQFVKSQYRDRTRLSGEGSARYDYDRRRWTIHTTGSVFTDFEFPREGRYRLRTYARAQLAGSEPPRMELRLGDQPLQVIEVKDAENTGKYELECRAPPGTHRVSAHFLNDFEDPTAESRDRRDRNLQITAFEIDGPLDARPEDYPPAHRELIAVLPKNPSSQSVQEAAHANLKPFLLRAFRRPATDDELSRFSRLVASAVDQGDSFEQGMQVALTAILVSPHFLFRAEGLPASSPPHPLPPSPPLLATENLNDHELASRLSYFLWSSLPDNELLAAASSGRLRDESSREKQTRRLLADPKSDALIQNFVTQWLNLRLLDGTAPDPDVFPNFDPALKAAMRRETELFAAAIIREDKSILEFLSGRFTFLNERLANHYGLGGITGDEFQRVSFTDDRRTGILTHASILTLTSNPGRTSPVKRGKWILENILGSPPPDPPPDVPDLETTQKSQPNLPLRKQLEIHRANAVCASCHKVMDQLGFGLENFDAIGRWREKDGQFSINPSGELPGGAKFNGPLSLARVLDKRRTEFVRCLSEKMLTFALGRELQVPDRCAVDKIVESVAAQDYRFSALVNAIASSDPFTKRRAAGAQP